MSSARPAERVERRGGGLPRTLVVGLGNPVLGDDGVGWRVAEEVRRRLDGRAAGGREADVQTAALGGLSLMERLVGYEEAILVDALATAGGPAGTVTVCDLDELPAHAAGHLDSAHDASLPAALRAGRALGAELPARITVIGVAAADVTTFGEALSPPVDAAVGVAAAAVIGLLDRGPVRSG